MAGEQQARYESALARYQEQYNKMIEEMQSAKEVAAEAIPEELTQVADMYAAGGTYGAGQRTILEEELKGATSAQQAALVASGMSSGSAARNIQSRYAKNLATGYQQIEDVRTDKLTSALQAVATAKEARGARMTSAYTTTAQLMSGYKEPSVSEFANAEELQAASDAAAKERLGMQLTSEEKIALKQIGASNLSSSLSYQLGLKQIEAQTELQAASQAFQKEQASKYNLTSSQQQDIARYNLFI